MANAVEQSSLYSSFIDARISFSNYFADSDRSSNQTVSSRTLQNQMNYKEAPVSSDFKFNVQNCGFTSAADEIFFGGVLLPLEKTSHHQTKVTTIRDELNAYDSDRTISKGGSRNWWKLGRNKSKKIHSNNNINFHLPHKSQNCLASILESDE